MPSGTPTICLFMAAWKNAYALLAFGIDSAMATSRFSTRVKRRLAPRTERGAGNALLASGPGGAAGMSRSEERRLKRRPTVQTHSDFKPNSTGRRAGLVSYSPLAFCNATSL